MQKYILIRNMTGDDHKGGITNIISYATPEQAQQAMVGRMVSWARDYVAEQEDIFLRPSTTDDQFLEDYSGKYFSYEVHSLSCSLTDRSGRRVVWRLCRL